MKIKLCTFILVFAALLARAQTNDLAALLQRGLLEEQANRNLPAAIAAYQALAAQFDKDRALAATAVFRLGECYRMQGQTNAAAAQYQRVLADFADQTILATLSRQNLAGMGLASSSASPDKSSVRSDGAALTGNADVALWNKVKDLELNTLISVLPTLVNDNLLTDLLQKRSSIESLLAQQRIDYSSTNPIVIRTEAELAEITRQLAVKATAIVQALKLRAELASGNAAPAAAPVDEESKEIQRYQAIVQNSPDLINATVKGGYGTPIANAAQRGWLKVAAYLLDHGADVNGGTGTAPLLLAAFNGNQAMVQFLLSRGANVNATDKNNQTGGNQREGTSLHIAAENGFLSIAEALLAHKADVNAQNDSGRTPLFVAVQNGRLAIVQTLLKAGADVNAKDKALMTPLMVAANPEIAKLLLDAGAQVNLVNQSGHTALGFATGRGSQEIIKLLLAAKADPNLGTINAPLLVAINQKDAASVELLLQAGANANAKGRVDWRMPYAGIQDYNNPIITPLFLAVVDSRSLPMVQLLLKYKADPNDSQTDGKPMLFNALSDTNILAALLDAGAKVDTTISVGNNYAVTALMSACYSGAAEAVDLLLQHGANPNARDSSGDTPLHYAACNTPSLRVFQLLLEHKADPNVRNNDGKTPLAIIETPRDSSRPASPRPPGALPQPSSGVASSEAKDVSAQIASLLRQHGALDRLPDWDRITVRRPANNYSQVVFAQGTNDWNQFTLLDAVLNAYYSHPRSSPLTLSGGTQPTPIRPISSWASPAVALPFPDLTRITIVRPSRDSTNETRITVNLLNGTNGIDGSKDVPLQFGDVVEIPEREHALSEPPVGLTFEEMCRINDLRQGQAKLIVKGQTAELPLWPVPEGSFISQVLASQDAQKVIQSSSDLSRVKVTRRNPATGQSQTWTLDVRASSPANDLWLRDGDLIEIPEKP